MQFGADTKSSDRDDSPSQERGTAPSIKATREQLTNHPHVEPESDRHAESEVKNRFGDTEQRRDTEKKPNRQGTKRDALLRSAVSQHPYVTTVAGILFLIGVVAGLMWWLNARQYESTDDAFIDARTVPISSQINGAIVEVPVTDNQAVEQGALLARLDARDYQAAVNLAIAQIDQANGNLSNLDAQIDAQQARIEQARKQVTEAQAALSFAQDEDARAQDLLRRGAGTQQRAQQTASELRQRRAAYDGAEANAVAAEKQIAVLRTQRKAVEGQLEQANAAKEQADVNLARTAIMAPANGRVAKLTAAVGVYAQAGQSLMMFVPRDVWVTANFKETQLADMRPGQEVEINVDAYGGRSFRGHVDSIQAGSGAAFSVLPPENATGNFVKVVQRVPVKIVFDEPPEVYLGPGMSVVPDVKVR